MSPIFLILLVVLIGLWTFIGLAIFIECANETKNSGKAILKLILISPLLGPFAFFGGIGVFIGFLHGKKIIETFFENLTKKIINWTNK